ncbi:alpha-L-fucosidase [Flammeovirgaceae bacterium SG7u.111]|nr:alpha-L-fucosidase [Flammeovirgaceae bacterium SG7u.132]WPO36418.1 alpha-L-fucosidase [Flammeovirgaceae bacterium SG7u.111]
MKKNFTVLVVLLLVWGAAFAQKYEPTPENLEAREWFQDARFGLFVHWGVYSVMGGGGDKGIAEWIMNQKKIPIKEYEKLPSFFNPVDFDAKEWVQMVKDAGMKYITITSKHHDGFAMYDSKVSDYNIVDKTSYGKDVLKLLKDECDKQGIKLFFYYSQLDWHHPDYYPRGRTGQGYTGRPDSGDWNKYIDYMNTQLTELLTNYGEVGGIWFDGMWDKKKANWRHEETYRLIHKLQPAALVGSNHHLAPFNGEDFQMFEKDLPGHNTTGFSGDSKVGSLPLETCETINGSWGFNIKDRNDKSLKTLVRYLVKASGYNANFLLNVGPMPNGKIQPEHAALLKEMGEWNKKYGETIFGTRGGPMPPRDWGVSTQKDGKVYLHIFDQPDESFLVPGLEGKKVKSVKLYDGKEGLKFKQTEFGLSVSLPYAKRNEIDTILEVEFK